MNRITTRIYNSPCGALKLGAFGDRLCLCDWQTGPHSLRVDNRLRRMLGAEFEDGNSEITELAARQLDEYFSGERQQFDVPLMPVGTDFQKIVWNELLKIPFGATLSYREIARLTGRTEAVRAVANAIGVNGLSIFIPCHRVVGADGSLTGYAGGLPAKRILLELEKGK